MANFKFEEEACSTAKMRVIGVGGAGGNAINRMVIDGLKDVEFIAVNTDSQDLQTNRASSKIQVGEKITRGLGAGAKPEVGKCSVEADRALITEKLEGSDLVFITAGMGGGTGTGGAPVVAQIAKELDILTIAIVTKPFTFEGPRRKRNAEAGIDELRKYVDSIIIIPNQRLLTAVDKRRPMEEVLQSADEVLCNATRGISDIISVNGLINVDFADVESVMKGMGDAIMGTGYASGENRATAAAEMAINSPLLNDISISGAKGVLVNVTGGDDFSMQDFEDVMTTVYDAVGLDNEPNIIAGNVVDSTMKDEIRVTVIATGFSTEIEDGKMSTSEKMTYVNKMQFLEKPLNVESSETKTNEIVSSKDEQLELGFRSEDVKEEIKNEIKEEVLEEEVVRTEMDLLVKDIELNKDVIEDKRDEKPNFIPNDIFSNGSIDHHNTIKDTSEMLKMDMENARQEVSRETNIITSEEETGKSSFSSSNSTISKEDINNDPYILEITKHGSNKRNNRLASGSHQMLDDLEIPAYLRVRSEGLEKPAFLRQQRD